MNHLLAYSLMAAIIASAALGMAWIGGADIGIARQRSRFAPQPWYRTADAWMTAFLVLIGMYAALVVLPRELPNGLRDVRIALTVPE